MEEIAAAVIEQASIDFYNILKKYINNIEKMPKKIETQLKRLIKFFKSEWYDDLASLCNFRISGIELMKILNQKVKDNIPMNRKAYA